jgi:hypothetical protein
MFGLFIEGGWEFMSLISLLALVMLYFAFKAGANIFGSSAANNRVAPASLYYVRFFGMLALVTGILGQIFGLYAAMQHIATQGDIPQQVMAGGIKVSAITTLYGFIVFLLAHLIWFVLDWKANKSIKA